MSDDLVNRLGDYATHLEDVGALPAAALVREAATRLSPPEGAGRDRVEAVARAREKVREAITTELMRQFDQGGAFAPFVHVGDDTDVCIDGHVNLNALVNAVLAVLPSEAEGACLPPLKPSIIAGAKWCQPSGQQSERQFVVKFADPDRGSATFTDEREAREYWARATQSWNCWLFAAMPIEPEAEGAYVMDTVRRWDEAASTFVVVDELVRRPTSEAEGAEMMREDGWVKIDGRRVRHVVRGSTYRKAAVGRAQCAKPINDMDPLVAYLGDDGEWYFRPPAEFEDGRFEPLPTPPRAK